MQQSRIRIQGHQAQTPPSDFQLAFHPHGARTDDVGATQRSLGEQSHPEDTAPMPTILQYMVQSDPDPRWQSQ